MDLVREDTYTIHNSTGYFMNLLDQNKLHELSRESDPNDIINTFGEAGIEGGYDDMFDGPGEYVVKNWNDELKDKSRATSNNWVNYQGQINKISGLVEYQLNNVDFDGYINGTLLEAKARYSWVLHPDNPKSDPDKTYGTFFGQLQRQVYGADGMDIEWHFLEKSTMDGFKNYLDKQGYDVPDNVTFKHTPKENK
jgi:hypothetical protein